MLIELRVENHRSIGAEQALSFTRQGRPRSAEVDPLLRVMALYGANASGKTNVLRALGWLRGAVTGSTLRWAPDEGVPREPFAWGPLAARPSTFEVRLSLGGVDHEYGFVVDDERVLEEWLYAWPHGRKQTWFAREGEAYTFSEHFTGEKRQIASLTRPNALFLSTATQLAHEQTRPIYDWFRKVKVANLHPRAPQAAGSGPLPGWVRAEGAGPALGAGDPGEAAAQQAQLLDLLRVADVGVVDVKLQAVADDAAEGPGGARRPPPRQRVLLQHQADDEGSWLPLDDESSGTQTLFGHGPMILSALRDGGLVIIDELESSLHPLLALHLVGLFADPALNPGGAQLLFSTHDTTLLGTTLGAPRLTRDQVWFTEKDQSGATRLFPLTDYAPRAHENIERGYLQGRYGATPFLGALRQAPPGAR